jgi:hypothetical protein
LKTIQTSISQDQLREALLGLVSPTSGSTPQEVIFEAQKTELERLRQDTIQEFGIDPADPKTDASNPKFRSKTFLREYAEVARVSETISYSSLASVVRYGVAKVLMTEYQRQSFDWMSLVNVIPSDSISELLYATYDTDIPTRVGPTEEADESRIIGKGFEIVNHEYARIIRIPKILVADDKTGQVLMRAQGMGRGYNLRQYQEVINLWITRTTWTNKNASGSDINGYALRVAYDALRVITDPMGLFLMVMPSILMCDVTRELTAKELTTAVWKSSIPYAPNSASVSAPSAANPGDPGYFGTPNPLNGLFGVSASPYIGQAGHGYDGVSPMWFLGEMARGPYYSDREPASVTQEDPNSGKSWSTRSMAWQVYGRFGTLFLDDYAWYRGN